jgi:hypothetical protein
VAGLSREPLVHFTLIGALLFVVHGWLNPMPGAADTDRQVHISEGHLQWLATTWTRQWHRAPTQAELRGLLADFVREELFAREARDLGLDRDDTVVNRRLAQKLAFLVEDTAHGEEPGAAELEHFHRTNGARFRSPARRSFEQVYFNPGQRPDALRDATAARARLLQRAGTDPADLGDRGLLEGRLEDVDEQAVAAQFGPDFASAVFALRAGEWSEPVASGYGVHLVRVTGERGAQARPFAEIRDAVAAAWRDERRVELAGRYYARLLAKYEIVMDEAVRLRVGELTPMLAATGRAAAATP